LEMNAHGQIGGHATPKDEHILTVDNLSIKSIQYR
jgi:hypothetical protein